MIDAPSITPADWARAREGRLSRLIADTPPWDKPREISFKSNPMAMTAMSVGRREAVASFVEMARAAEGITKSEFMAATGTTLCVADDVVADACRLGLVAFFQCRQFADGPPPQDHDARILWELASRPRGVTTREVADVCACSINAAMKRLRAIDARKRLNIYMAPMEGSDDAAQGRHLD